MLIKAEELITSQKLGSRIFGKSLTVFSIKINLLLIDPDLLDLVKQNCFLNISSPVFPSRTNIPVMVLKNSSIGV